MHHVFLYYTLVIVAFLSGVTGMFVVLMGGWHGAMTIAMAIYLQHRANEIREPAYIIMAIKRAGYIVTKMADEHTTEEESIKLFHKELKHEMIRRNIPYAEEKADDLAKSNPFKPE